MKPKDILPLLKQTWKEFSEDKASRLGAALSYYTAFSIAPLLILGIKALNWIYGSGQGAERLHDELTKYVGPVMANNVATLVQEAGTHQGSGTLATIIGIVMLLLGASGAFVQLQDALNTIWEVTPRPDIGIKGILKQRALSFAVVFGTGVIVLLSIVASTVVQSISRAASNILPIPGWCLEGANTLVTLVVICLLFGLIFKVLPDAEISWRDVVHGAVVTGVLFILGKYALGFYLGHSGATSSYGQAGSLVAILLWVYYASQIFFFGAEITQVYANRFGSRVRPAPEAIDVNEAVRAEEGATHQDAVKTAAERTPRPDTGKGNGNRSSGSLSNGNQASSNGSHSSGNGSTGSSDRNGANGNSKNGASSNGNGHDSSNTADGDRDRRALRL